MQFSTDKSRTVVFNSDEMVPLKASSLSRPLRKIMRSEMGISSLFHMQEQVLSHVLNISSKGLIGDIILCAPTGSGKTLAYALPIVQDLMGRKIPRLRAIVVVPTRDLGLQVAAVFEGLIAHSDITVGIISGAASVAAETTLLAEAEILIATPGRLVDHVRNGELLSLRSVRYLVLDESDRLLQESFQGWIESVVPLAGAQVSTRRFRAGGAETLHGRPTSGILALAIQPEISGRSFTRAPQSSEESVRKILVSATQTRNPKRLMGLGLRRPTIFEPIATSVSASNAGLGYNVPSSMTEEGFVVDTMNDKLLALLRILAWHPDPSFSRSHESTSLRAGGVKLVFTKSVESAHRLCRLLEIVCHRFRVSTDVLEMSGELSPRRREFVLQAIQSRYTSSKDKVIRTLIVVSSDLLARGMDMINVHAVINYDAPVHIRTYLHRAGRTARAGREGAVVTLLLAKQAHHFRKMVALAERGNRRVRVENMNLQTFARGEFAVGLPKSLAVLARIIARERLGLLECDECLPSHALHELWQRLGDVSEHVGPEEEHSGSAMTGEELTASEEPRKKRKKVMSAEVVDSHDIIEGASSEGTDDISRTDDLRGLLFAQIARNLWTQSSS